MRRSSLPNLKDNLVVTHANAHLPHSPNVARSWSPRQIRVRAEERLARSVGDREQERKVLEWCKKHNVNVIRKLPKLDSTVLTSRGVNTEKFINFVDEAKVVERETPAKPPDYSKERVSSAEQRKHFCEFCQRAMPKKKRRRRHPTFFTSPYECEHCGTSNDIDDDSEHTDSSSESEDDPTPSERVSDTIRRGNPAQVIDHRTFPESAEKSENHSEEVVENNDDDNDIFWREVDTFQGNFEEKMSDLSLSDFRETTSRGTVFLTETPVGNHSNRPMEVKMAWDDDSGNQFAEISRTTAKDDGIEDDVSSADNRSGTLENTSEKSEGYSENVESGNPNLFPESEVVRLSPTPPSQNRPRSSPVPRKLRYGEYHGQGSLGLEITAVDEGSAGETKDMTQSPIANRSVGLTRVALMRLSRQSRPGSGARQPVARIQEPPSHSHDPQEPYSFLDAVSPEIKSIHERQKRPDSPDS